jgi:hypothetical protein
MGRLDRDLIAIWFGGYERGLDSVSGLEFGVTLHLRVIELGGESLSWFVGDCARVARFRVDWIYIIEEPVKPANKAWLTASFLETI